MKYTILGFSQAKLLKHNLTINDAHILRWFIDFYHTGRMYKIIDQDTGDIYSWVKYDAIIEDLPLLGITNIRVVARRFDAFVGCGLMKKIIKKTAKGTFACFSLVSEIYNDLISYENEKDEECAKKENKEEKTEVSTQVIPTVLKSTVGIKHREKTGPTVLKSTVPTVLKSTVLLDNPSTKNQSITAAAIRSIFLECDNELIFDNDFYQEAAVFLNKNNLETDYIKYLHETLHKKKNITNRSGYLYKIFWQSAYVERYNARKTKTYAQRGTEYKCKVCSYTYFTLGDAICPECKTPANATNAQQERYKKLYAMSEVEKTKLAKEIFNSFKKSYPKPEAT